MADVMLYSVLFASVIGMGCGLYRGDLLLSYPGIFSSVTAVWVWPQMHQLMQWEEFPESVILSLLSMIILSFLAAIAGQRYSWPVSRHITGLVKISLYSSGVIYTILFVMTCVGLFSFHRMSGLIVETTEQYGGQWSGPITIYFFFSKIAFYAACMALAFYLLTGRISFFAMFMVSIFPTAYSGLIYGKREAFLSLSVLALLTMQYRLQFHKARIFTFLVLIFGIIFSSNIEIYRNDFWKQGVGYTTQGAEFASFVDEAKIEFINAKSATIDLEVRNAAILFSISNYGKGHDYGASFWNKFVTSVIPDQLLSRGLVDGIKSHNRHDLTDSGYHIKTGLTVTGFATSYVSFSYPGAFLFFTISFIISSFLRLAYSGDLTSLALSMALIPEAALSITHSTSGFFISLIFSIIFILLPLKLSQAKVSHASLECCGKVIFC